MSTGCTKQPRQHRRGFFITLAAGPGFYRFQDGYRMNWE